MGGLGYFTIGDINRCIESFNQALRWASFADYDDSLNGEIKGLNNFGFDWEVELRIDISSKFAIGIGTGYMHRTKESSLIYTTRAEWGEGVSIYSFKPKVTAIPIILETYYNLPLTSKSELFLNGGIGYYFAKASQVKKVESINPFGPGRGEISWQVDSNGFAFHSGIGLEYNLTKNLALVIEGQGRYAKIKRLKGEIDMGA
jgi:opacity protein-like surface antigen